MFSSDAIDSAHLSEGMTEDEIEWTKDSLCKCVNVASAPAVVVDTAAKELFGSVVQQKAPSASTVGVEWAALEASAFFPVALTSKAGPASLPLPPARGNLDTELVSLLNSGEAAALTPVRRAATPSSVASTDKPSAPVAASVALGSPLPPQPQLHRSNSRSPPPLPAGPFPLSWSHLELHGESGLVFTQLSSAFHKHAMDHSFDPSTWTVRACSFPGCRVSFALHTGRCRPFV